MADITRLSTASLDLKSAQHVPYIAAVFAGEDLEAGQPCRFGSDGYVYLADADVTTLSGVADYAGFCPSTVMSGCAVTLFGKGARFSFAAGMTPNTHLYISDTAGELADAKVASIDSPVALAISATDIVVLK